MNKLIGKKIIFLIVIILVVFSFWFGGYIASNLTAQSVYGVQAKLAFRHLKEYEEIYSYLNLNCQPQAIVKLEFLIDLQKMLIAEYIQSNEDKELEKYISLRDPSLIRELRHYNIDWSKTLIQDKC